MALPAALLLCAAILGCGRNAAEEAEENRETVPNVVTADIKAGIEHHIEEKTQEGEGYYRLGFRDDELKLKLVKVHTEWLANLGPRRHFACVDLADTKGNVYDVDFFLAGDPGEMTVTETTVHKINGQPLYAWKQRANGTWKRISVEEASPRELGVLTGRDEFDFLYRAILPDITGPARAWLPLPQTDRWQTVTTNFIDVPVEQRVLEEPEFGNKALFLELGPEHSGRTLEMSFHVQRLEKAPYQEDPQLERYLSAESRVPLSERFRRIARKTVTGKEGDLERARALYDHTIERMRYAKYGEGWGEGDAVFACDAERGNCTDFHSYFIALARAVGIPARFAIGASIPSARDHGGVNGYHCWAEFYAEDKWWPVDISEGDKCSPLTTYFFGHHPANRVELSRGRDLAFDPGPQTGPINFFAYPVLEIEGRPAKAAVTFLFERKDSGESLDSPAS
ncbi:MAG: transglutaminase-like domain-containing protein [Planctomycetota bacterium]